MGRVTSNDVARLAGVSRTTVSLVLNEVENARISEATKKKVREAAEQLNYRPNALAQSLKTNRSKVIGLIIPSITNPFFPSIAQGVEDVAVSNGYNVFLCNSFRQPDKENNYIQALASKQVDGIIFASFSTACDSEVFSDLKKRGVAVVVFDAQIKDPDVDSVLFDNVKGAEMAVEYLLSLGHRNIAFLSGPINISSRNDRLEGYKKALTSAEIPINPDYIIIDKVSEENDYARNYEIESGFRMASKVLEQSPEVTAYFAINDMTALGALKAINARGLRVPEDISLMGFDDINLAEIANPPLSTIRQEKYKMGKVAAELLLSRIEGSDSPTPKHITIFSPELVIRQSCQPPKDR